MDAYKEWKASGAPRKEFLERAAEIPGLYVPAFYDVTYNEDCLLYTSLRKLKGILSSANMTYRNEIRVVKTTYGFKEKDYRENGTDMNLGSINSFVLSKREVPDVYKRQVLSHLFF